jgi:hypothetical protein
VRTAVASVDGTPSTPSLARIAVAAAAAADISAYASQDIQSPYGVDQVTPPFSVLKTRPSSSVTVALTNRPRMRAPRTL